MFAAGNYHLLDLKEIGGPLECFVNGDGESLTRLFPAIEERATTLAVSSAAGRATPPSGKRW